MAMALAALVIALGGYLIFGSPQLPGQPLAARQAKPLETQDAQLLLAKIEAHLQKNPEDGKGWDVVAPFYLKVRRYDSAVRAYSNAIRILGESATRLSGLGEALTQANDGLVTAEARESFEKAANMSPDMIHPRFYLALALEQDGKLAEAADAWHKLLLAGPESAPWRALAEHRLAALRKTLADRPGEPGPSAEDVRQAEDMSAEDRAGMIENMVAGLAARLKEDGNDLAGWLRLIRAYGVLGRIDDLSRAIGDAREQFSQNPDALAQIDAAATQAGAPVTKP
jgi:cytochrome c-type biogenesis protein CcmH